MLFIEYEKCKRDYDNTRFRHEEILFEADEIFTRTQPSAIRYDQDRVISSAKGDAMDEYVAEWEERLLDKRLKYSRELLERKKFNLEYAEKQLRESGEVIDKVYVARYLDNRTAKEICYKLCYSSSQVYKLLCDISKIQKSEKIGKNRKKSEK